MSGPSGSGKTTLSKQILVKIKNGFVLSTDNYYKTGIISYILSKLVLGYFDKRISFDYKLFKKDFHFILNNRISINERSYDFKEKKINNFLKEVKNIEFLIVEGIFASDFLSTLYNQKCIFLELKTAKNECMARAVQRDVSERGKEKKQAKNDFLNSWDIYYAKFKNKTFNRNKDKIIITKNTNIDHLLKKIFN